MLNILRSKKLQNFELRTTTTFMDVSLPELCSAPFEKCDAQRDDDDGRQKHDQSHRAKAGKK
jgi:hypothetical protein